MAETTEKDQISAEEIQNAGGNESPNPNEVPLLPHQDVLETMITEGLIETKKDIDPKLRQQLHGLENSYKNNYLKGRATENTIKKSEQFANQLLEIRKQLIAKNKAAAGQPGRDELIAQGDESFNLGNYQEAHVLYTEALSMDPTDSYLQGQLEKIDSHFAALANEEQMQAQYDTHVSEGAKLMQEGKLVEAREEYAKAFELNPNDTALQDTINQIDAHLNGRTQQTQTISDNPSVLVSIMNDIERVCKDRGKITTQEILDAGLTKFPVEKSEFSVGNKTKHGKVLTLVKVSDGVYELKKAKGLSTGAKIGIGLGIAALVGTAIWFFTGRKKNG